MILIKSALLAAGIIPLAASADPTQWLLASGPVGIFAVLIITGQLRTKAEVENLKEQLAVKDRQIEAFTRNVTGSAMPALAQATRMVESVPKGDQALLKRLERVMNLLEGTMDDGDPGHGSN